MRLYETSFLIAPTLPEEEAEKLIEKMAGIITEKKGKMINVDKWGKRRLAYPIKKFEDAVYVFFLYKGEVDIPLELERNFKQTESVIRYLTIKLEERDNVRKVKKGTPRTAGAPREESPEDEKPEEEARIEEVPAEPAPEEEQPQIEAEAKVEDEAGGDEKKEEAPKETKVDAPADTKKEATEEPEEEATAEQKKVKKEDKEEKKADAKTPVKKKEGAAAAGTAPKKKAKETETKKKEPAPEKKEGVVKEEKEK